MKFIVFFSRVFVPRKIRARIRLFFDKSDMGLLRKEIINYYSKISKKELTKEQTEVIKFIKYNDVGVFPYSFSLNYSPDNLKVFEDVENSMYFLMHENKKLYFKKGLSEKDVKDVYNLLCLEQDKNSPHRYLTDTFNINQSDVVADVGAAEGNFSLSIVDKVNKLYIFEADIEWIQALKLTFLPWQHKVHIINKYVSDVDDENNITLDNFLNDDINLNFVKIDTEGAEKRIFDGSKNLLTKNKNLKIAVCTYHNQNDANEISHYLKNYEFNLSFSYGYMIFHYDKLEPPYLRKGLIRAVKK